MNKFPDCWSKAAKPVVHMINEIDSIFINNSYHEQLVAFLANCRTAEEFSINVEFVSADYYINRKQQPKQELTKEGIIKQHWPQKYFSQLPAIVIFATDCDLEDWETAAKDQLAATMRKIQELRDILKTLEIRLILINFVNNEKEQSKSIKTINQQKDKVRRQLQLDAKSFFCLNSNDIKAKIDSVATLVRGICVAFYTTNIKRYKSIETSLDAADFMLVARYTFKIAYLHEFTAQYTESLAYYRKCFIVLCTFADAVTDRQWLDQLKAVASMVNMKICYYFLKSGRIIEALEQFRLNIYGMQEKFQAVAAAYKGGGGGGYHYSDYEWVSDQYLIFVELLDKHSVNYVAIVPDAERCYYYHNAARCTIQRQNAFEAVKDKFPADSPKFRFLDNATYLGSVCDVPADLKDQVEVVAYSLEHYGVFNESSVNHSQLIMDYLHKALTLLPAATSGRRAGLLLKLFALQHAAKKEYLQAIECLQRVVKPLWTEGWIVQCVAPLKLILKYAALLGKPAVYLDAAAMLYTAANEKTTDHITLSEKEALHQNILLLLETVATPCTSVNDVRKLLNNRRSFCNTAMEPQMCQSNYGIGALDPSSIEYCLPSATTVKLASVCDMFMIGVEFNTSVTEVNTVLQLQLRISSKFVNEMGERESLRLSEVRVYFTENALVRTFKHCAANIRRNSGGAGSVYTVGSGGEAVANADQMNKDVVLTPLILPANGYLDLPLSIYVAEKRFGSFVSAFSMLYVEKVEIVLRNDVDVEDAAHDAVAIQPTQQREKDESQVNSIKVESKIDCATHEEISLEEAEIESNLAMVDIDLQEDNSPSNLATKEPPSDGRIERQLIFAIPFVTPKDTIRSWYFDKRFVRIVADAHTYDANTGDKLTEMKLSNNSDSKRGDAQRQKKMDDVAAELVLAAGRGDIVRVKTLLSEGADPNQINKYGHSPLYWASQNGHKEVVIALLEHGADPHRTNKYGETAIYRASLWGHDGVVAVLMYYGATSKQPNNHPAVSVCQDLPERLLTKGVTYAWMTMIREGFFDHIQGIIPPRAEKAIMQVYSAYTATIDTASSNVFMVSSQDTGNTLVHSIALHGSEELIKYTLRIAPSHIYSVRNAEERTVLDLLNLRNVSMEILAEAAVSTPADCIWINSHDNSDNSVGGSGGYSRFELQLLHSALSGGKTYNVETTVHLHFCGHGLAGKTTLVNSMFRGLHRVTRWQRNNPFRTREVDDIPITERTIGQSQSVYVEEGYRWVLHDYGGQEEYHVNHANFLSMPNSVFMVVLPLYDVVEQKPYSVDVICSRFKYWLRFINSVVEEESKAPVVVVANQLKAIRADPSIVPALSAIVTQWESAPSNRLMFVGLPMVINAKLIDTSRALHQDLVQKAVRLMSTRPSGKPAIVKAALDMKSSELPILSKAGLRKFLTSCAQQTVTTVVFKPGSSMNDKVLDYVCYAAEKQLESMGEIVKVDDWVVADVEWLTKHLLGQLIKSFGMKADGRLKPVQLSLEEINKATVALRTDFQTINNNTENQLLMTELLVKVGLCIPVESASRGKLWFPIFATERATTTDCQPLHRLNRTCRIIVRQFHLRDYETQTFPSGYFSKLIVNIATKYDAMRDQIFVYENAFIMTFVTKEGEGKIVLKSCTDASNCMYFELTLSFLYGNGVSIVYPTTAWAEFNRVRSFIVSDSSSWLKHVPIQELFVNPRDNHTVSEEELYHNLTTQEGIQLDYFKLHLYGVYGTCDSAGDAASSTSAPSSSTTVGSGISSSWLLADESIPLQDIKDTQLTKLMKRLDAMQAEIVRRQQGLAEEVAKLQMGGQNTLSEQLESIKSELITGSEKSAT